MTTSATDEIEGGDHVQAHREQVRSDRSVRIEPAGCTQPQDDLQAGRIEGEEEVNVLFARPVGGDASEPCCAGIPADPRSDGGRILDVTPRLYGSVIRRLDLTYPRERQKMPAKPVTISMTRFADFVVTDPLGQVAKVREVRRQYEQPYRPGGDFWSRWREQVAEVHQRGGNRSDIELIGTSAQDHRAGQYASACAGYNRFWGHKRLRIVGFPVPTVWPYGTLQVRVNPEWILEVSGKPMVVKLHLKEKLQLNQRLANPLLRLLDQHFGPSVGGPPVAILDVHRGKILRPTARSGGMDAALRMQAAAFLAGWEAVGASSRVA